MTSFHRCVPSGSSPGFPANVLSTAVLVCFVGCFAERQDQLPSPDVSAAVPPPAAQSESGSDDRRETAARFVDMTQRSGIAFEYRNGEEAARFLILESLGGGVALVDYDCDGELDVFAPGGGGFAPEPAVRGLPSALFRNEGDWCFLEVSRQSGADLARHYTHGVSAADYNEDGFPDLLVTGYGGPLLFCNRGDGTFEEVADAARLDDPLWSTSAGWGDLDGDGMLDLYVAHYVNWSFENDPFCPAAIPGEREVCAPKVFDALPDTIFASNGDGTFRDASEEFGLHEKGKGLGVLIADVDLDGDLDVYVANDAEPNFLYCNDGTGRLREIGILSGTALSAEGVAEGSMGVELADFNLDGRPDLWVTNYERQSIAAYRNDGNATFHHVSQMTGVTAVGRLYVGWGTTFFDFDHDGDEDVFVSNGHVERFPEHAPALQSCLLFENLDGRWLENVAPLAGDWMSQPQMGRGAAVGDLDGDGDLDLAVSRVNQPLALVANEMRSANHWISLRLIGTRGPRSAIGTQVKLSTAGASQIRQVKGGASYASSSDPRVHFGLGRDGIIERLEIRWPSGTVQVLRNIPADQLLTVFESDVE